MDNPINLLELARQCPQMAVTVRLQDLLAANQRLAKQVRLEAECDTTKSFGELGDVFIPAAQAQVALGNPDRSTMWRWEKKGYLRPRHIGTKKFYRKSDIELIINSNKDL